MNPAIPTIGPPSTSSLQQIQPSTSSTVSKIDHIRNRLRYIQCEPHEVIEIRRSLISSGILPKTVSSLMCSFKARVLKTPESVISNHKKQAFIQAITESGKSKKSIQGQNKIGKQKTKKKNQSKTLPYITTEAINTIESNPSEPNIARLISCLSNAKIYITDVPKCLVILTKAMVNHKKIISICYKYKHSVNTSICLTDGEKDTIHKHIETYLQSIKVKIHSPQPEDASEQIKEIKNQLKHPPVTLDQLVAARCKLKQLGQSAKDIHRIIRAYTSKLITSKMSPSDKDRYLKECQQSMHLTRAKLVEQAIQTSETASPEEDTLSWSDYDD